MRSFLFIAVAALLTSENVIALQISTPEGLACFENLPTPEYPKAELPAHVDGSVWTWTQLSPQGVPDKIETQVVSAWGDGPKLMPPVEKAIRGAKIKSECTGRKSGLSSATRLRGRPRLIRK